MNPTELASLRSLADDVDADRQLARGALTPRARVAALADPGSVFEIGALAHCQQPAVTEPTPADGLVTAFARVGGREVALIAEDPLVLTRTDGQVANNKRERLIANAAARGLPVVAFVDGPSAATTSFPLGKGKLHGGMSTQLPGTPSSELRGLVLSAVFGPIRGGVAHIVAAADISVAVRRPGADADGADIVVDDDHAAIDLLRRALALVPADPNSPLRPVAPVEAESALAAGGPLLDSVRHGLFDSDTMIGFVGGPALATGLARIGGYPVAFAVSRGETDGLLDLDDVGAFRRLVRLARRHRLPVLTVQDTAGYNPRDAKSAPFRRAVHEAGEELQRARTARCSLVAGQGHVGGRFLLGGRQLGYEYVIAWPGASVSTDDVSDHPLEDPATRPSAEAEGPWLAAGLGLLDDVVRPDETRARLTAILSILAPSRSYPSPERDRRNRPISDVSRI